MKQVNKVVSRKILTKAGEKSLTSFVKLVPVARAAVGYTVDRGYIRVLSRVGGPRSHLATVLHLHSS